MAAQPNALEVNQMARAAILSRAIKMTQQIYAQTIASPASTSNVVNIAPRNVGLILGFYIEIEATIANTGANAITPTTLGPANILQQIVFNDLNNNVRINTTGWHLNMLNSAKRNRVYASAVTTDTPIGYGNVAARNPISATASISSAGTGTVRMLYWVPLAYSAIDLRGAVFANVVNATMNLQLVINNNPVVASNADTTLAVYTGTSAQGNISSITIKVYQQYLDQLPIGKNNQPVLPIMDLSTIYELKQTTVTGIVANQDFPIQYANFRDFLSTFVLVDNGGTLSNGADVNYIALQSANFTNILQVDPYILSEMARNKIGDDFPQGLYYLDHREKPISTVQYGNMQTVLNLNTVNQGAQIMMGYEDFALVNVISGAGSLPAG